MVFLSNPEEIKMQAKERYKKCARHTHTLAKGGSKECILAKKEEQISLRSDAAEKERLSRQSRSGRRFPKFRYG